MTRTLTKIQKARIRCLILALRSEKYKQIHENLRTKDGFCANGVLCDVYRLRTKNGKYNWVESYWYFGRWCYELRDGVPKAASDLFPPKEIMEYFGLSSDYLIELNDLRRLSFKKIADILEKHIS